MTLLVIRRSLVTVACAAAFAMAAAPLVALAQDQKETETVDRTLPFPSGGTLKLNNFSGPVRITGGSGRNFVMKAIRRGTADRLKEIQLSVETSGSTITVEANKRDRDAERRRDDDRNNVIETSFEIQVPADARLEIDAFSSDVTITGVEGRQQLKTFSGDIIASGSRSPLTANSFSGDIELDLLGHGATPDVEAETFNGDMRVKLAGNARGDIEFNSFSGSFDAAFPVSLRSSSRRNVRAELPGGSGQRLRFKSFSGTLRLVK